MRRALLNKYIDLLGQADVLHAIREAPKRYVPFIGAGVSKEARVPLAQEICEQIRGKLLIGRDIADQDTWARDHLAWDDPSRRYMACLNAYGSAEQRVIYFRQLLKDARPAFAHHAIALLMSRGVLCETALTTNFDKLLERAFLEQGSRECQAIRTPEEAEYWVQEDDKCYVLKLHGDYDTHNILNTQPETRSVPDFFLDHALSLLRGRGLLVLGSAGNEESIVSFVKSLLASPDRPVLSAGIRWGVFVGSRRPDKLTADDELKQLELAIERGAVSRQVVDLLGDMHDKFGDRRPCSFFPVWGSGNLMLQLVESSGNIPLVQAAQLLLDHNMRLHATFRAQHLNVDVIEAHIDRLEKAQHNIGLDREFPGRPVPPSFSAEASAERTEIRIAYGDITSRIMMSDPKFHGCRRAVVSPEDTTVSAGGGVALRLLNKAGPRQILNELSKLSPIEHGTCAVTSAGDLPANYIIHAAALKICTDGSYDINPVRVQSATAEALAISEVLKIDALWIPLLGAGVASMPAADSLTAILSAIRSSKTALSKRCLTIVIYQESVLARDAVRSALKGALSPAFSITEL